MSEINEIIVGIVSSIITACIFLIATQFYNKLKLRKEGIRVLMFRKDRIIEERFISSDSKVFCWRGGQYRVREDHVASCIIGNGGHPRVGMREIFFNEGNPEPFP